MRGRLAVIAVTVVGLIVVLVTNEWLTDRFVDSTRSRAELRQALYSGNLVSELQRNSVVPLLLSRDPNLINALTTGDFSQTSQRLISYNEELAAASITLLDATGRIVASTDRTRIGANNRTAPDFIAALRSNETVFTTFQNEAGAYQFTYARIARAAGKLAGVVIVEADLKKFPQSWSGVFDAVMITDSAGTVILTTEPLWRGHSVEEALALEPAPSALVRAFRATNEWRGTMFSDFVQGQAVLRLDNRIPFQGWRMITFTPYTSVRERVNGVLALELTVFAILLAAAFYFASRRDRARSAIFQKESAELRQLNEALQREIAERERAERNLEVAEQTLAQSSKLAALGEMSAAVSHELNQPLAAMKTYLAGASLLLQRKRPDEALAAFNRIDGLIERMGAITRQLKSYARKGGDAVEPIDVRDCISSALSMMEPQLKDRDVAITRTVPAEPVIVMADRVRLEQVVINLLRNALDAVKTSSDPAVDILVSASHNAVISVRDNGEGIADLENLFEPFYTTKAPGDGVGLGLAISSGIVNDLGGRLTARNGRSGGAVFEVQLPLAGDAVEAAE